MDGGEGASVITLLVLCFTLCYDTSLYIISAQRRRQAQRGHMDGGEGTLLFSP
jgi:hypothetical protein